MTAYDWQRWAERHPLRAEVIPAQDDFAMHKPEVIQLVREGHAIQATRAELEAALAGLQRLPLDPLPWVVKSVSYGDTRFATEADCWLGYRAHFQPRSSEGFSTNREDYPE